MMRVLGDNAKKNELAAMLIELNMDFHQLLSRAMDKKDVETALELSELKHCIDKLLKGIEL